MHKEQGAVWLERQGVHLGKRSDLRPLPGEGARALVDTLCWVQEVVLGWQRQCVFWKVG